VILLTLGVVIGLIILIARFKVHAFLALLLASLAVGAFSGMPLSSIASAFQTGVGNTLGFIAVVVGLGTMLGKMLAESGGAEAVAEAFIRLLGPRRIHWTMMLVGFIVGLPVFFGVGLVLLVPIIFAVARKGNIPLLLLGIPAVAGLSASHGLVPPHPGPMVAIATFGADTGKTILYSVLVALPAAIVGGPIFAKFISPRIPVEIGGIGAKLAASTNQQRRPGLAITLLTILLPVLLMIISTVAALTLPPQHAMRILADFVGSPLLAMLVAVLFSFFSFGWNCGFTRQQILEFMESCVGPAASIFLVVGAGGGFSKVLDESGAGKAIARMAADLQLSPLLLGWLIAAAIRVAVGSATVTITMTAGLMAPVAAAHPELSREFLVIAMGAGSLILSHLNDGGFWFVKEYLNMSVPQTLKTWTVLETIMSVTGLLGVLLLNKVFAP
jgi:GntP family gluconate:H+ symporter